MLDKQFDELRLTGNLPSPTGAGLRILQLTQSEDASLEDVAVVLQADPTLTGRLLKLANSGTTGSRSGVTTAKAAAMRLGLQSVRTISLGFSLLASNRSGRCKTFDYDGFWSHSLAAAVSAQCLSELSGDVVPSEAFTCGLLQGMGRLALASIHPVAYEGVLERAHGLTSAQLADIEQDNFGMNHRELAEAMLRDWRMPEAFCVAVAHVGSGAPVEDMGSPTALSTTRTLSDARDIARALTADIDASAHACKRILSGLNGLKSRLQFDDEAFAALWERVVAEWSAWGEVMSVRAKVTLSLEDIRRRAEDPTPAVEEPAQPKLTAEPRPESTGLRILLVGPELSRTDSLGQALAESGHTVTTAADGRSGLELALKCAPHLVLCDWDAPELSGLELVHLLRQSDVGNRLHCVIVADRDKDTRLLEVFEAGADEYVLRPFDAKIVVARARAALRFVQLDERVSNLLAEREAQIGQLAIMTRKLKIAAVTDPLTGLFNRRFAGERLNKSFDIARAGSSPLSVIMIDIDRFKLVNDGYGHDTGDVVLRDTARLMAGLLRKGDALCRMGGEEFLAICPGANFDGGIEVAERIRRAVRKNVIRFGTFDQAVTISLGVAQLDPTHADVDALLKSADERVYLAKQNGRDQVVATDLPAPLRATG